MEVIHRHGNLADRLHRVGVEERPMPVGDRGQLGYWLNCADLVVRVHDRDQGGVVCDRRLEGRRVNDARAVNGEQRGRPPAPGERLERVEDRLVLDGGGNEMPTTG